LNAILPIILTTILTPWRQELQALHHTLYFRTQNFTSTITNVLPMTKETHAK
jgi:hypothetical protein